MEFTSTQWDQVKLVIKQRNPDNRLIASWVEPINFIEFIDHLEKPRVILGVPSPLHKYFVMENLINLIYEEIRTVFQTPFEVDINVTGQRQQTDFFSKTNSQPSPVVKPHSDHLTPNQGYSLNTSPSAPLKLDQLNPDYSFSTFVVGRNTEFAHAASFNVARNPGSEGYNPLFICGPVGMGKTHLLHAVGNEIRTHFPYLKILYITAEKFLNECVSGIRRQEMDKFRSKFRDNADILLVDDVQYIGKTEAIQTEFFHTLNSFFDKKKQVILASDRMPKDILGLEDRSRSRLEWGLIADISMPDLETRMAILKYKAEKMALRLSEEVVSYVAKISKRSIREIEGNLKKIKMFSELQGVSIDIDLVRRVLANHETQSTISAEEIQKLVADHYKVKVSDLKSPTRAKQIVVPRQVAMYLIKKHLDRSLMDIGRFFGGKDHTTVMNALERVDLLQSKNVDLKNDIEELTTRIHTITGV